MLFDHESKHIKTMTSPFFAASPDVCGEAASFTNRTIAYEYREQEQMRMIHGSDLNEENN